MAALNPWRVRDLIEHLQTHFDPDAHVEIERRDGQTGYPVSDNVPLEYVSAEDHGAVALLTIMED